MKQENTPVPEDRASTEKLPLVQPSRPMLFITPRTNLLLFMTVFNTIVLLYILLAVLSPGSSVFQNSLIFDHFLANFIFLGASFVFISLGIHGAVRFGLKKLLGTRWFQPKFGQVGVSEKFISDEQLREALAEQKRKLGETLVQGGKLMPQHLEEALRHQKTVPAPLGRLLRDLGYSTEEDIQWALSKMGRKLGEILVEKEMITKDDIIWLLGQQTGPRRI